MKDASNIMSLHYANEEHILIKKLKNKVNICFKAYKNNIFQTLTSDVRDHSSTGFFNFKYKIFTISVFFLNQTAIRNIKIVIVNEQDEDILTISIKKLALSLNIGSSLNISLSDDQE
jgi:hypothetical protein